MDYLSENKSQKEEELKQILKSNNPLFNYSKVTNDPVQNFFRNGYDSVPLVLDLFFEEFAKENEELVNKIEDDFSQIEELNKAIDDYKKSNKITLKKIKSIGIILLCLLIVGFFLIPKFKELRKDINNFVQFRQEKKDAINKLIKNIEDYNSILFGKINYKTIALYVFKKWGFTYSEDAYKSIFYDFQPERYSLLLNEKSLLKPTLVSIDNYISFYYKSTPFVDAEIIRHYFRTVQTSRSESYPYTVVRRRKVNGTWETYTETRYETLTATHYEETPFLTPRYLLMSKTNFHPEISFDLNMAEFPKKRKKLVFENSEFQKKIDIRFHNEELRPIRCINSDVCLDYDYYEDQMSAPILEFLTIKTQEDIVSLKNLGIEHELYKIDSNFFINREALSRVNFFKKFNTSSFNQLLYLYKTPQENFDKIKESCSPYLYSLIQALSLIFVFPVFNRESYLTNHNYRISQQKQEIDEIIRDDWKTLIWTYWRHFSFIKGENTTRSWLTLENWEYWNEEETILAIDVNLNSYYSKKLIDSIRVCGKHTGCHIIDVPYERFYKMTEEKGIFIVNKTKAKSFINEEKTEENNNIWQQNWRHFSFIPFQLRTFLKYLQMFPIQDKTQQIQELTSILEEEQIKTITEESRVIVLVNNGDTDITKMKKVVKLIDEIMND
ncbi:hypothetical protein [Mycoplasma sp. 1654_15]|uniref:hypothetical protein n=1 Tax=Mycoplasma sp. 1654_15 TaxID=2725994 RepID=UPI001448F335|nr:hypothetical protein [Mycoplasma sp. 1654_15]QJB71006.1 hypothetical protein HF996_00530 [Mycoplasma sp. 1654_15]